MFPKTPAFAILAILSTLVPAAHAQGSARPNIVLIMADDMGYETVGAYGGTSYLTPEIDQLAAEGVRFEHAFAQPLCTPSRVQIMTGKYNVRNYEAFGILPRGQVTYANLLRQAGYATFIGGKWQLSENSATPFDDPVGFGFDEYFLWQLERRPRRYYQPGFEALVPSAGWNKQRVNFNTPGAFGPDLVVDQINAFITRNQAAPFFVYYPMMLPHDPFLPTPDHPDYNPNATTEPNNPIYFRSMAEYTDKMVGRVVDHIESLGLTSNTLVIFTADNGTLNTIVSQVDGQGVRGGKGAATNAGTRVPFIARWPGRFAGGRVSSQLVDFSDVLPTVVEAAGEPIPADIDGFSLLPELENASGTGRNTSYLWYLPRNDNPADISEYVRDTRYKLYRTGAFYDVEADPLETSPLDLGSLDGAEQAAYDTLVAALASFDDEVTDRTQAPRFAPDPWDIAPQAGEEDGQAIMTAAAATDANGPLEYQFRNATTNAVGEWTFGRSHEVDGLPGGTYLFQYRTRDLLGNVSAWSASAEVSIGGGPPPPAGALVTYDFSGDSLAPTSVSGLAASSLSSGGGLVNFPTFNTLHSGPSGVPSLAATGWQGVDFAGAVAAGDFLEFTITIPDGAVFIPSRLDFHVNRNSGGPRNYEVRWSADGYASALGQGSVSESSGVGNLPPITLSLPAAPRTGSLTFRLAGLNRTSQTSDAFRIDDLTLNGELVQSPTARVREARRESGRFVVELEGLVEGATYRLLRDTTLPFGSGQVEVDSLSAIQPTDTLEDEGPLPEPRAFYRIEGP